MHNEHRCHAGKMNRDCGPRGGRFAQHKQEIFAAKFGFRRVPVNIEETENSFIIQLFAPALVKENLKVVTKDDVLTISYTPIESAETSKKFSRREYTNGDFERAFALNGKVLSDAITAAYADGILKVTLPKNPETNVPAKDIVVN